MDAVTQAQSMLPWGDARECHRNLTSGKNGIVSTGCDVLIAQSYLLNDRHEIGQSAHTPSELKSLLCYVS